MPYYLVVDIRIMFVVVLQNTLPINKHKVVFKFKK